LSDYEGRVLDLGNSWHPLCQCLVHGGFRRSAGTRAAIESEPLEGRQLAAVERSDEGCAAGVGDLGVGEAEHLELRQHSSRRRQRTCRRRRRQKGGESLVAEWAAEETESL